MFKPLVYLGYLAIFTKNITKNIGCTDSIKQELFRHLFSKLIYCFPAGAVHWHDVVRTDSFHLVDCRLDNRIKYLPCKVKVTHNCVDPVSNCNFLCMFYGIDNPCMGATADNNKPFVFQFNYKPLIVKERVSYPFSINFSLGPGKTFFE